MTTSEPTATALVLTTAGALLALSILSSRALERVGVPVVLIFLGIGMLAGSEGIGGIAFDNFAAAYRLGMLALVLILFDGGLNTPLEVLHTALRPAAILATVGVIGTAALLAIAAHAIGLPWPEALLIGAIVSSTDAAAVFAVLRGSGLQLQKRVGATLELESGINDPMAVILTTALAQQLVTPAAPIDWWLPLKVVGELGVGALVGAGLGLGGRLGLARLRLTASGLYPVLMLALALLAFGAATLLGGSGLLAVYVAAIVLGNGPLPFRGGLLRVHDALAWLAQITMFLVFGLLVFPTQLAPVALTGTVLALVLAFIARPVVVAACLWPFGYTAREIIYVGFVGLRGAVPIVLAMVPVLAGVPGAGEVFHVVFFIVVVNALVPGGTVAWLTRKLGLQSGRAAAPPAVLQIESRTPLKGELLSFAIDPALAVAGLSLADLPFPDGAAATLIVRGDELVPPRGTTILQPGDHLYIVSRPEDRAFIQLLFGRPEED